MQQNFDLLNVLQERAKEIGPLEHVLGKGLYQPFNCTNSGPRKIMQGIHLEHMVLPKCRELPLIQTGHENSFGEYNSSLLKSESNMIVLSIIPKFTFNTKMVYYVIAADIDKKELKLFVRTPYEYTSEVYGYPYNTSMLDNMREGTVIRPDEVIRCSTAYDEYQNRMDGINVNLTYINTDKNMQDSIIISKDLAEKFSSPRVKEVTLMFNDNDIPLNLYGSPSSYKSFPDIGERIENGILAAIRRDKSNESEYTQSSEMLAKIMMSDDKFTINGIVYDLDIFCNNPKILEMNMYNTQLYKYYTNSYRCKSEIINTVDKLKAEYSEYRVDYDLDKLYFKSKQELLGVPYTKEKGKQFSNTVVKMRVVDMKPVEIGDKMVNRFGGKGVVSFIFPKELMPRNEETGEYADAVINSSTCTNRENPGQMFELHVNSASAQLVRFLNLTVLTKNECFDEILDFLDIICPAQGRALAEYIASNSKEYTDMLLDDIMDKGYINLSIEPISESISIDVLAELYRRFPWMHDPYLISPMRMSNGKYRRVRSRRCMPFGRVYMYRLKQYAEEKFTATSLSATNAKGLNAKSKANKDSKSPHGKTPIQFGNMETGDIGSIGMEYVVHNLMIHSVSPHGRRLMEQALTGDPYDIDIRLDDEAVNRNVEILNTYLKTMGIRLIFRKIKIETRECIIMQPIMEIENPRSNFEMSAISNIPRYLNKEYAEEITNYTNKVIKDRLKSPLIVSPVVALPEDQIKILEQDKFNV